jgi:hypothetical protein
MQVLEYKKVYKNNMGPIVRGNEPYINGSLYSRRLVPDEDDWDCDEEDFEVSSYFERESNYWWPDLFNRAGNKEFEFIWVPGKHSHYLYMTADKQLVDRESQK